MPEEPVALFQHQWQLYRKFVDNNYFYHREVYGRLHRIFVDEAVQPFRFLDIACGDARATVEALKGTREEERKRDRSNIRRGDVFFVLLLRCFGLLCWRPRQPDTLPAGQSRRSRVLPLRFQGNSAVGIANTRL
jgi:hypothetical protein